MGFVTFKAAHQRHSPCISIHTEPERLQDRIQAVVPSSGTHHPSSTAICVIFCRWPSLFFHFHESRNCLLRLPLRGPCRTTAALGPSMQRRTRDVPWSRPLDPGKTCPFWRRRTNQHPRAWLGSWFECGLKAPDLINKSTYKLNGAACFDCRLFRSRCSESVKQNDKNNGHTWCQFRVWESESRRTSHVPKIKGLDTSLEKPWWTPMIGFCCHSRQHLANKGPDAPPPIVALLGAVTPACSSVQHSAMTTYRRRLLTTTRPCGSKTEQLRLSAATLKPDGRGLWFDNVTGTLQDRRVIRARSSSLMCNGVSPSHRRPEQAPAPGSS
jgi:hypothetical protein